MKQRVLAEKPLLPAQLVTFEQRLLGVETARQAGHIVLECGPKALDDHQIITVNPTDHSDAGLWYDWRQPYREADTDTQYLICSGHISGVTYEGVRRRQERGRSYTHLDVSPEAISAGDLIALRIDDEVFFSHRVREVSAEPAVAVAESRIHVPKLVLSAE